MGNRRIFLRVWQFVLFGRHRKVERSLDSLYRAKMRVRWRTKPIFAKKMNSYSFYHVNIKRPSISESRIQAERNWPLSTLASRIVRIQSRNYYGDFELLNFPVILVEGTKICFDWSNWFKVIETQLMVYSTNGILKLLWNKFRIGGRK